MSQTKKHLYYTFPLFMWICLIFYMSHQNATESSELSSQVGLWIGKLLIPGFEGMEDSNKMLYADSIQFIVRKAAHVCEYLMLGILTSRFVCNIKGELNEKYWMAVAFAIGVLYAVTDEIHQLFIPGRSGQVTDVLIDSIGVVSGILLYKWWRMLISGKKIKK